jgi:hypothetical protein
MTLRELEQVLNLERLTPALAPQVTVNSEKLEDDAADVDITRGYASDLLSDVMGNAPEESVLITIQAHKNTIAVATLAGIVAVVICNGRDIPADMVDAAKDEGIALFRTEENQFSVSGRIFKSLEQ